MDKIYQHFGRTHMLPQKLLLDESAEDCVCTRGNRYEDLSTLHYRKNVIRHLDPSYWKDAENHLSLVTSVLNKVIIENLSSDNDDGEHYYHEASHHFHPQAERKVHCLLLGDQGHFKWATSFRNSKFREQDLIVR